MTSTGEIHPDARGQKGLDVAFCWDIKEGRDGGKWTQRADEEYPAQEGN